MKLWLYVAHTTSVKDEIGMAGSKSTQTRFVYYRDNHIHYSLLSQLSCMHLLILTCVNYLYLLMYYGLSTGVTHLFQNLPQIVDHSCCSCLSI